MLRIRIEKSQQVVEKEIDACVCKIGRSPFADITLNDNFISYNHLVIVEILGHIFLFDKGLNRVLINGIPIEKHSPYYIKNGDEVRVGDYAMSIEDRGNSIDSKTLFLCENINAGIELKDIFEVCNRGDDYYFLYADNELDLVKCVKRANIEEINSNAFSRVIRVLKSEVRFYVILNTSRFFSHTFSNNRNKPKKKLGILDWIIISISIVTIIVSVLLIIYFSI